MVFAVIPAGGKSTRMGRPKLSLPVGERTVLDLVIDALRRAGIEPILVVIGPHASELVPVAQAAGAHALLLDEETPDMRATVERGLRWLEERFDPRPEDAWMLVPADHPTLAPEVARRLLQARTESPDDSIFIPTYQGKRGHPTLIGWKHVPGIHALDVGQGLNVYLRRQAAETREVPVDGAEILWDLDTPEDYERLCQWWQRDV